MGVNSFLHGFKTTLIIIAVVAAVWFFKDYQHQKAENMRQSENMRQIRSQDSLRYAQIVLNKNEMIEELRYNNPELLKKLEELNIKINRVQRIITTQQTYRDTSRVKTEAKGLVKAVIEGTPMSLPVIDSTDCWFMEGVIEFDGERIYFDVLDRKFKNTTDIVTYWERNLWSFLGIKTRLFGKKQITVEVINTCGETKTFIIENKNLLRK